MSRRRTRRQYLTGLAAAGVAGVAGCSAGESGTGTDAGETPTTTGEPRTGPDGGGGTVPGWAQWVPAEAPTGTNGELGSVDVARARREWPQRFYRDSNVVEVADWLGVDDATVDRYVTVVGSGLMVMTGAFDPSAVRENFEASESATTTERGFTVVPANPPVYVSDSAVVTGNGAPLDAKFGETPSLDTDEDWRTLLSVLAGATFVLASPTTDWSELTTAPTLGGFASNTANDGGVEITFHLLFDTGAQAAEAAENDRDAIRGRLEGGRISVEEIGSEGRRIVVDATSPTHNFA